MHVNIGNFTGRVKTMPVKLPGAHKIGSGHITGMDLRAILRRIEQRLPEVGLSADAASKKAGKPDAIRNLKRAIESGRDGITTGTIEALAPILETYEPWLCFALGPPSTDPAATQIPVWGKAGAGGAVDSFHENGAPIGEIDRPEGATEHTGAVEITGGSLGKPLDGWYAIYDEVRDPPTEDMEGHLCVVETKGGRVYIKALKKERGNKFTLISSVGRPKKGVEIKWAAKVKGLVPR